MDGYFGEFYTNKIKNVTEKNVRKDKNKKKRQLKNSTAKIIIISFLCQSTPHWVTFIRTETIHI